MIDGVTAALTRDVLANPQPDYRRMPALREVHARVRARGGAGIDELLEVVATAWQAGYVAGCEDTSRGTQSDDVTTSATITMDQ